MARLTTTEARKDFSKVLNKAGVRKERVILTRQGKDLVAMVPVEDLELLEALEDRLDNELADKAIAEMEAKGEKPVDLATVKRELGL
ncbi:MAG: type II toxin-antitoxin system prevent-host-death family antitoxin [Deltaproteobacteria bacterium]|nr:type II toxin-antitoxin system prevent-host-death family antitoxin [Deltaproteobacteria bacterium]